MTTFNYCIREGGFYDDAASAKPSRPMALSYGDMPTLGLSFPPDGLTAGDTVVFAADDDMIFYSDDPGNILHSASCMVVSKRVVTEEEASAGKIALPINTRTVKFRDAVNGRARGVDVTMALYRLHGDAYSVLAKGRGTAHGIVADYDSLPEPIAANDYYTRDELDRLMAEMAPSDATVTLLQGDTVKGAFSLNQTKPATIELEAGGDGAAMPEVPQDGRTYGIRDGQWVPIEAAPQPTETAEMRYGVIRGGVHSLSRVTASMLMGGLMTAATAREGTVTLSCLPGDLIVAALPDGWTARRGDSMGAFDEDIGGNGTGGNGERSVWLAGERYRLFGQWDLVTADFPIRIMREEEA